LVRRSIIEGYEALNLTLDDPRFTDPAGLRLARFLFGISIGFDQEEHFAKMYICAIIDFVMEYNREAGFAELRVFLTLSDIGQHVDVWLDQQLDVILAAATLEDTPVIIDVIMLLVAKQKISPAVLAERVDWGPILCHLFAVLKTVVDAELVATILDRIDRSPERSAF
jgi:hypothetical protein